jgi:hypothetical protein
MLHACFTPIALCFADTSWHFYVFSGTNLLTRCHSASSYFLLFLYFRKVVQKIFSELDEMKSEFPILLSRTRSLKKRWRRAPRQPHHRVAPPGRAWPWCGPLGRPPTSPFRLYIASDTKTLNRQASIHEKFRSAAAIKEKFRGTEISVPAPCLDGELPPEPSPSTPPSSPSTLLTPMMRRK